MRRRWGIGARGLGSGKDVIGSGEEMELQMQGLEKGEEGRRF